MLNKNKRNCSTPNFYTMFKQNTGKVSKYRSNITLAKKTYLGVPSNLEKKKFPSKNTMVNNKRQYNRHLTTIGTKTTTCRLDHLTMDQCIHNSIEYTKQQTNVCRPDANVNIQ